MSNGGRPSQIRKNGNGDGGNMEVPPDIVWNDEEPPFIFNCSQDIVHDPRCDGNCGGQYPVESEVQLMNLARAYARVNMSHGGIIQAYVRAIPVQGFQVDPFDLLLWLEVLREVVCEKLDMDTEELDEIWRQRKIKVLTDVYDANAPRVKEARAQQALGIVQKKLLGPDGQPL